MAEFDHKLAQLRSDLSTQGDRTVELVLQAVEAYFERDTERAAEILAQDDVINRVDIEIERRCVPLLAMGVTDERRIRAVLTIAKINNELERIGNCGVRIAEIVPDCSSDTHRHQIPKTFRVMANSVIGILRETNRALRADDPDMAERILGYDHTVEQFRREIGLDAQRQVADGTFEIGFAFRLESVVANLERIADHCTNICEQIIYYNRGLVVKHLPEGWTKPQPPPVGE